MKRRRAGEVPAQELSERTAYAESRLSKSPVKCTCEPAVGKETSIAARQPALRALRALYYNAESGWNHGAVVPMGGGAYLFAPDNDLRHWLHDLPAALF